MFTRHPFERLVSAYRNKLENADEAEDGEYFYLNYGRRIVEKYRTDRNRMHDVPSRYNDVEIDDGKVMIEKDSDVNFKKEPYFEEFIDYIINTDINSFDEHWKPMWLQCNVCDIKFDVIIHYENFKNEIQTLINHLQEKYKLPNDFTINWENKGSTNDEKTLSYFNKIPKDKIMKVYEKYIEDFEYFQYNISSYM